jgi:EAL domain-containing protein (putative c-di-GMP-specific phosphodiesterase class I)
VRRFVNPTNAAGCKVALDDFGAGYTSFSYLKELPADVLKIDGTFIRSVNEHPANLAIVEAIVSLARSLGMRTIAEWAEDRETVETLIEAGIDFIQGYVVARPQQPELILTAQSSAGFIQDERLRQYVRGLTDDGLPAPLFEMAAPVKPTDLH